MDAEADSHKKAVMARRKRLLEGDLEEQREIKANFRFLMQQLNLFGQLCQGRNDFCINVITRELKYLTWEEAFLCLTDPQLTNKLRAKYCEIIISKPFPALDVRHLAICGLSPQISSSMLASTARKWIRSRSPSSLTPSL